MPTREEWLDKARLAHEAGDSETARLLVQKARAAQDMPAEAPPPPQEGDTSRSPVAAVGDAVVAQGREAVGGFADRSADLWRGAKQLVTPKSSARYAELQNEIDTAKAENDAKPFSAARTVGSLVPDLVSFALPGGLVAKGVTLLPKAASFLNAARAGSTWATANPALAARLAQAAASGAEGAPSALVKLAAKTAPVTAPLVEATAALARAQTATGLPGAAARLAGGVGTGVAQSAVEPVASDESQWDKTLAGGAGGALGTVAQAGLGRVVTPFRTTSPERSAMARLLAREGVPVSAGQATGSPTLQSLEVGLRSIPFTAPAMTAGSPGQRAAFSAAVGRRTGETADGPLTADVLAAAHDRLGSEFNRVASAAPAATDNLLRQQLDAALEAATQHHTATGTFPAERALQAQLDRAVAGRDITGAEYAAARSALSKEAVGAGRAGNVAEADVLRQLRDANDAWAERNLKIAPNPFAGDAAAADLAKTRQQYGTLLDVEKAVDAEGHINPARFARTQERRVGTAAYKSGEGGDVAELARAAETVLKSQGPDSGTARNLFMAKLLSDPLALRALVGGAAVGGGAYGLSGQENAMRLGAGGATLGTALALTQTAAGRRYLSNALMNQGLPRKAADMARYFGPSIGASAAMREDLGGAL